MRFAHDVSVYKCTLKTSEYARGIPTMIFNYKATA